MIRKYPGYPYIMESCYLYWYIYSLSVFGSVLLPHKVVCTFGNKPYRTKLWDAKNASSTLRVMFCGFTGSHRSYNLDLRCVK